MKASKFYPIIIGLAFIGVIMGLLFNNKKKIDEKAERSLQTNVAIPVYASTPQYISDTTKIEVTGRVISENEVLIVSKTQGLILEKYKKAGDVVKKGDVIAKVEDNIICDNLRFAKQNLIKARKDLERYQSLFKAGVVTKTEVESIEILMRSAEIAVIELKEQLKNTIIFAQTNGILEKDFFELGTLVSPGSPIGEIVDPKKLKLHTTVSSGNFILLKKKTPVVFKIDVYPNKLFNGEIDLIGSKSDESMTYDVGISFSFDYSDLLKPGMYAFIEINIPRQENTKILSIERNCIVGSLKNPKVYVIQSGKAHLTEITTGKTIGDRIEVINGLTSGEKVVSNGQINLSNGISVTVL
ncbi:efflux RND transporter periplasmic adaptor subunit [Bacteroides sp.]|jgi:efflux transporter, RND family, MFP subunit|uniref:efflux RND transporter periplasmic adaptor subunit n=1 Tax=Bacteroides sp. TaxID=29523 RepID=UPI0026113218|nr:efflux RND transporter periplasmic adaptor subunit [Bacteroides sp.]MDD3038036.1 efflux RND transporter periplasmic adaptor subunit [Bacteroides sp.]